MTLSIDISITAILLVFYLAAIFHSKVIRKSSLFLIGGAGLMLSFLAVGLFGSIFAADPGDNRWARVLQGILTAAGDIVAFVALTMACFGDRLPISMPSERGPARPRVPQEPAKPNHTEEA